MPTNNTDAQTLTREQEEAEIQRQRVIVSGALVAIRADAGLAPLACIAAALDIAERGGLTDDVRRGLVSAFTQAIQQIDPFGKFAPEPPDIPTVAH